jgi:hypothetical protein
LLDPFNEHVIVAPAVIYKTLQATFGMTSGLPYYVVAITLFSIAGGLLFAFLRVRVGGWLAFAAVLPVLFLGAASEDLLWAFQMGFFGSVAAGLGMLLALERRDSRGDLVASVLVVVALCFSSVGIPFAIAAVVDVLVGPAPRRRRLLVPGAGICAYLIWQVGWGHTAEHHVSWHNLAHLPGHLINVMGTGVAALCGRRVGDFSNFGTAPLGFRILALTLMVALFVKIARERRVSRGLAVAITLGLSFWILVCLDSDPSRPPTAARYAYPSAVFILLLAGEALSGLTLPRLSTVVVVVVAAVAAVAGVRWLAQERPNWENMANLARAALAGVEEAGAEASSNQVIKAAEIGATVSSYRDTAGRFGTPAFDEREVRERASTMGAAVDSSFLEATRTRLLPMSEAGLSSAASHCRRWSGTKRAGRAVPAGDLILTDLGDFRAYVEVAGFDPEGGTFLGSIEPGASASVELPEGAWKEPWRLILERGPVRVCTAAAPQ